MNKTEKRTRKIIGDVLKMDAEEIQADASVRSTPGWDSLNHMNLLLALEDEFDIEFTHEEIATLDSVASLVQAIGAHNS
jgi:acyl carrier protein